MQRTAMLPCVWCVIVVECMLSSCALCVIASATPYALKACVRMRMDGEDNAAWLRHRRHFLRVQLDPLDHLAQSGC